MTEYSNRSRSAEIALEDHEAFLDDPGRFLEHEYFLPGRPNSLASLTFPFSISVVRGAWDWYAREPKDDAPPRYTKFYRADHDSGALALTTAILQAFHRDASLRGQTPIVAVLAKGLDLKEFLRTGTWTYEPLIDALEAHDIEVLNVGAHMMEAIGESDPCQLLDDC